MVVSLRRSWFLSQTREWVNLWVGLHSVNRTIGIVGVYGVCVLGCAREDSVEGALPIVAACEPVAAKPKPNAMATAKNSLRIDFS